MGNFLNHARMLRAVPFLRADSTTTHNIDINACPDSLKTLAVRRPAPIPYRSRLRAVR